MKLYKNIKRKSFEVVSYLWYLKNLIKYNLKPLKVDLLTINQTLDYAIKNRTSISRFGDGEILLIYGEDIQFQKYDDNLSMKLKKIISLESNQDLLICLPDIFNGLKKYKFRSRKLWASHINRYYNFYKENCENGFYGNAFISRPYFIYKDKSEVTNNFNMLKKLWENQDVLIVEGESSKSGVGNDLFKKSKSVKRILAPSENAYQQYGEIINQTKKYGDNKLILLMLGPTASVMAADLSKEGYWAIDLGHVDSEYEWYLMGANEKVKIPHKHTAEFNDDDLVFQADATYNSEIIINLNE